RQQLLLPHTTSLVVADAFAGRLAIVDVDKNRVESVRSLPAHNIRGLTLSADDTRLFLTHQILNPQGRSSFDDIHWGNLMTNNLRTVAVADLLQPGADLLGHSQLEQLGDVGRGAADPAGVAITPAGKIVVTLAGV